MLFPSTVHPHVTSWCHPRVRTRGASVAHLESEQKTRFAANESAKIRSLVGPFKLEFDLLFVPLSFVLDVELGASGHVDPFSGHLDLESLTRFEGVGQPAQLRYKLGRRVDLLNIPIPLFAHWFSLGSLNDQPLDILPCPTA